MNYRLGALGFLSHPALTAEDKAHPTSGNYGFEDQQAALRWVKENVGAFGGDAGKVTIFGESAGGYSVCAHLIAPDSAGLFQRAISESGIGSPFTATTREAQYSRGEAVARTMGCGGGADLLQCLRGKSADDFVNMMSSSMLPGGLFFQGSSTAQGDAGVADAGSAGAADAGAAASGPWSPVNDGVVIPAGIGTAGAGFAKVPLLLGTNSNEGSLFTSPALFGGIPVANDGEYQAALARSFGRPSDRHRSHAFSRYPVLNIQ